MYLYAPTGSSSFSGVRDKHAVPVIATLMLDNATTCADTYQHNSCSIPALLSIPVATVLGPASSASQHVRRQDKGTRQHHSHPSHAHCSFVLLPTVWSRMTLDASLLLN